MVSYERLWKTMEKKGISQYRLINHYKISAGCKLSNNLQ